MAIRLSARGIIIHDSKILLNKYGDGVYYDFPGGRIEEDETAPEAVAREVREETGYSVEVGEYVCTFEYEANRCGHYEGGGHRVQVFFRCGLKDGAQLASPFHTDHAFNDPSVASRPAWIPLSDLGSIPFVPAAIRESLLEYLETGIFRPAYMECMKPV